MARALARVIFLLPLHLILKKIHHLHGFLKAECNEAIFCKR
jgi:hypothetical protein